MTRITVIFRGYAGSDRDRECAKIFAKHKGECNGGETYLGEKSERDVDYTVPDDRAEACSKELRAAGFSPLINIDDGA